MISDNFHLVARQHMRGGRGEKSKKQTIVPYFLYNNYTSQTNYRITERTFSQTFEPEQNPPLQNCLFTPELTYHGCEVLTFSVAEASGNTIVGADVMVWY